MELKVEISTETGAELKARADAAGVDVATLAARLLDHALKRPRSLEEISGEVAQDFAKSGMTEDELSDLLEREKHAMRAEKRAKRSA